MAKWCAGGETITLQRLLTGTDAPTYLYVGLYLNNTEPADNATLSSLTEVSGASYSRIAINKSDWTITGDTAVNLLKTFTAGEDWGTITGYFITDASSGTSGDLYGVETFTSIDSPFTVYNGGNIKVTPRIIVE